ncbi:hypothetical protein M514_19792 [Trichuris suis]|uniref:Uncharacterized protein n=1 Tax=Trichuris suis TaxID=68888 RepID=A0A085NF57_9BILA|nr:hypothetical protein M514_19792 [Trichuris suis]
MILSVLSCRTVNSEYFYAGLATRWKLSYECTVLKTRKMAAFSEVVAAPLNDMFTEIDDSSTE